MCTTPCKSKYGFATYFWITFGWLIEDLLSRRHADIETDAEATLKRVAAMCLADTPQERPSFAEVVSMLGST